MSELTPASVKHVVQAHWSARAATFDDQPNHGLHNDQQRALWVDVLRRLAGDSQLRVLDVGCGTGFLTLLLAELGHHAEGLDIAEPMLERARMKAAAAGLDIPFFSGDAENLTEIEDGRYDLIVERHVIWTLPDPAGALREWRRILAPGGRVALIEGNWRRSGVAQSDYEPIVTGLPLAGGMASSRLETLLAEAGFGPAMLEPLTDPAFWGLTEARDRYLLSAPRL